jgi:hypothetical protein
MVMVWAMSTVATPGAVQVHATLDVEALKTALNAKNLTITAVTIRSGEAGQLGTYTDFTNPPVTIADGIVLSSGEAALVGPPADPVLDFPEPNWWMGGLGTVEFDAYGPGHIENFDASYDVAALQVDFHLATNSPIKFNFIFGSVEFPSWTGDYTDALLVFLDGTNPTNQIAFDKNLQPVQVGKSFAGLVATGDKNTAFASPHGVLLQLTTTSAMLPAGDHTIIFEVGDVNDDILDSAAFISNLRAETGEQGTEPVEPPPALMVEGYQLRGNTNFLSLKWPDLGVEHVLQQAESLTGAWTDIASSRTTNENWLHTSVENTNRTLFYRLRRE